MIEPDQETPRGSSGAGFSDSVSVAFGDADADVFGLLRLELEPGSPGEVSALALLFADREPVVTLASEASPVVEPAWTRLEAAGVALEVVEPLAAWRAQLTTPGGQLELELSSASPPLEISAGGLDGYAQLCRVRGTATIGSSVHQLECLGERVHCWGAIDWDRTRLARTLSAWLSPKQALIVAAVRPEKARGHDVEEISAQLTDGESVIGIEDARISTTQDGEGRLRRAGLELWESDDAVYPRRLGGEAICGSTLIFGGIELESAFFEWHMGEQQGVGHCDLRRRP
ncbi:MAG TPA: hypothetical protein VHE14_00975 [Solirubrobacteraceae bacterium]|nr:hypothetical protein [Solirubrobacteraceae bacterium]